MLPALGSTAEMISALRLHVGHSEMYSRTWKQTSGQVPATVCFSSLVPRNAQRLQNSLDLPPMGRCNVFLMPRLTEINPGRFEGARVCTVGDERRR